MTCEEFSKMLDNYENLTDDEKFNMIRHSEECENCKRELDFDLSLREALRTLPRMEAPADFIDNLNARLDRENVSFNRRAGFRHTLTKYSAIAASLILAVIIGANGKSMLDMMNDDSGVISETTLTSDSAEDTGAESTVEAESAENAIGLSDDEEFIIPPALQNRRPKAGGEKPAAESGTDTQSSEYESGETLTETSQTVTAEKSEEEESAVIVLSETAAPATEYPKTESQTASETPKEEKAVIAESEIDSETDEEDGYVINDDASGETYAYIADSEDVSSSPKSSSYSLNAEIDPEDYHIAIDGIITVKSSSYESAITVIAKYVSGIYNDCYVITGTQFDNMIDELYSKDVEFDSSVIQNSDPISFKIIVVN